MLKLENLKDLKITAELNGERVEVTKIDLYNQSCNIIKSVYGKKIRIAYNSADEFGRLLVIGNFKNVEISEGQSIQKDKLK